MKKIMLVAVLVLSGSAFAEVCQVDLVSTDRYTPSRVLTTFRSNDGHNGCAVALRQCQQESERNRSYRTECRRVRITTPMPDNRPQPRPNPRPIPRPRPEPRPDYPIPYPSYDAKRPVGMGESVIVNNKFQTVIGTSFNGTFSVRSSDTWNTVTNNVRRENISLTNGCNMDLCANDSVINTISGKTLTLVGISYDDTFVTMSNDSWQTITSWNRREHLAKTQGCVTVRYAYLCVGDTVLNVFNREASVIGIQQDGRVVLQTKDSWRTVTTNQDPTNLVVIR